jgi:hypothetical protein
MGSISDWLTGSVRELDGFVDGTGPLTLAEVLAATDLAIERVDERWVLLLQGFPREWQGTQEEAEEAARRWNHMEPTIEHAPGPTWLVFTGDQYEFSSTSKDEAEGFVFGVAVGMFHEQVEEQELRLYVQSEIASPFGHV